MRLRLILLHIWILQIVNMFKRMHIDIKSIILFDTMNCDLNKRLIDLDVVISTKNRGCLYRV